MAFDFGQSWTDDIAEVTGRSEFQRATIEIMDWSDVTFGDIDFATGQRPQTGEPVEVYRGQARIVGIRSGAQIEGGEMANSTTLVALRFQVPKGALGGIGRGQAVKVLSSPESPWIEQYAYKVTDGFQGSAAASRTFEAGVDLDSAWVTSGP